MKSGELFAGVGGLGMAVDEVFGSTPAWFCEFDEAPSRVLAHHFPDVPNFGDVRKVDWSSVEHVNILAGGFPCQDVSLAGRRRGMRDGTRSGLWSEFARAIDTIRPDWVLIENVRGLLTADGEPPHDALITATDELDRINALARMADRFLNENPARRREGRTPHVVEWRRIAVRIARSRKRAVRVFDRERRLVRRAIDTVLRDLAELGFDAEWTGLRAADVGAPHGRFRVFILAWPRERTVADAGNGPRVGEWARARSGRRDPEADLTLLPTPAVVMNDGESVDTWMERRERIKATGINGNGMGMPLPIAVQLLPTPDAYAGDRGGSQHPDKRRRGGHVVTLQDVAEHALLPTLSVSNSHGNETNGRGEPLLPGVAVEVAGKLLPTPMVGSTSPAAHGQISGQFRDAMDKALAAWGDYAPAIERWSRVFGRPAPSPTRADGKGGKARLNPELPEWMMGWPLGWVTAAVIGLSRAQQLKCAGNGVVPQQAAAAIREMLSRPGVPLVPLPALSERESSEAVDHGLAPGRELDGLRDGAVGRHHGETTIDPSHLALNAPYDIGDPVVVGDRAKRVHRTVGARGELSGFAELDGVVWVVDSHAAESRASVEPGIGVAS